MHFRKRDWMDVVADGVADAIYGAVFVVFFALMYWMTKHAIGLPQDWALGISLVWVLAPFSTMPR